MRYRVARIVLALALAGGRAWAADPATEDPHAARDGFIADRRGLMTVLGGWSLGSVGVGAAMWTSSAPLVRYAGVQNVAWGVIDGAIAAYALYSTRGQAREEAPAEHWREERAKMRRVFWINVALDVLYVAGGVALVSLGLGKKDEVRGSGFGIVGQGGFLLAFDTVGALVIGP